MKKLSKLLAMLLSMLLVVSSAAFAVSADDHITVTFNGTPITFDAQPELNNGRTMVPMRAVFETFGCEVGFDEATSTVHATRGDTAIELTVDSTTATVGDEQLTLDAAPYLKDGRTYVPVRFIAESLDSQVYWDAATQEVIVVNLDKFKADLENSSEFMKLLLNMPITMDKAYKSDGTMSFDITLTGEAFGEGKLAVSLTMTEEAKGIESAGSATVTLDMSSLLGALEKLETVQTGEDDAAAMELLSGPIELTADMVCDKDMNLYIKLTGLHDIIAAVDEAAAKDISDDTWYKLDAAKLLEQLSPLTGGMTMDLDALLEAETVWDGMKSMLEGAELDSMDSLMMRSMYQSYAVMFGDDNVTKTANEDGSDTYVISIDKDKMMAMTAQQVAELMGVSEEEALEQLKADPAYEAMEMDYTMSVTQKDGVFTDMSFDMGMSVPTGQEDISGMAMSIKMEMASEEIDAADVTITVPEQPVDLMDSIGELFQGIVFAPEVQEPDVSDVADNTVRVFMPAEAQAAYGAALEQAAENLQYDLDAVYAAAGQTVEAYNLRIAAGDASAFFAFDQITAEQFGTLLEQGAFLPLDEYLDSAADVKALLGDGKDFAKAEDGKVYALPLIEGGTVTENAFYLLQGTDNADKAVELYNEFIKVLNADE